MNEPSRESASRPSVKIIVASVHHGNTRRVAESLAQPLHAELLSISEAEGQALSTCTMVGLGSGIYFGRHHRTLLEFVDSVERLPKQVFVFSTAGLPFLWRLQHRALRRRLITRGCRIVGEFCCRGWDTVGPLWLLGGINRRHPDDHDLKRAADFAGHLNAAIR